MPPRAKFAVPGLLPGVLGSIMGWAPFFLAVEEGEHWVSAWVGLVALFLVSTVLDYFKESAIRGARPPLWSAAVPLLLYAAAVELPYHVFIEGLNAVKEHSADGFRCPREILSRLFHVQSGPGQAVWWGDFVLFFAWWTLLAVLISAFLGRASKKGADGGHVASFGSAVAAMAAGLGVLILVLVAMRGVRAIFNWGEVRAYLNSTGFQQWLYIIPFLGLAVRFSTGLLFGTGLWGPAALAVGVAFGASAQNTALFPNPFERRWPSAVGFGLTAAALLATMPARTRSECHTWVAGMSGPFRWLMDIPDLLIRSGPIGWIVAAVAVGLLWYALSFIDTDAIHGLLLLLPMLLVIVIGIVALIPLLFQIRALAVMAGEAAAVWAAVAGSVLLVRWLTSDAPGDRMRRLIPAGALGLAVVVAAISWRYDQKAITPFAVLIAAGALVAWKRRGLAHLFAPLWTSSLACIVVWTLGGLRIPAMYQEFHQLDSLPVVPSSTRRIPTEELIRTDLARQPSELADFGARQAGVDSLLRQWPGNRSVAEQNWRNYRNETHADLESYEGQLQRLQNKVKERPTYDDVAAIDREMQAISWELGGRAFPVRDEKTRKAMIEGDERTRDRILEIDPSRPASVIASLQQLRTDALCRLRRDEDNLPTIFTLALTGSIAFFVAMAVGEARREA